MIDNAMVVAWVIRGADCATMLPGRIGRFVLIKSRAVTRTAMGQGLVTSGDQEEALRAFLTLWLNAAD